MALVGGNLKYVVSEDDKFFMKNFQVGCTKVRVCKGRKIMIRNRGYGRQWLFAIFTAKGPGMALSPSLKWHNKKVKIEWYK